MDRLQLGYNSYKNGIDELNMWSEGLSDATILDFHNELSG
jgi:hypothetical protein